MAKRFTDTALGRKKWFRILSPKMKCVWRFLCDECDHAGIWDIDEDAFEYFIGEAVTISEVLEAFGERVKLLADQKLFVKAFVEFQYGTLNSSNKVHLSVQKRLERVGANKPLASPLQGAKDTDTDKEKEKDKEKEGECEGEKLSELEVTELFRIWNEKCHPLPPAQKLTDKRKAHGKAQIKKYPSIDHWLTVLAAWKKSDFCLTQWKPTFEDWLNETKRISTLEGKYDNREGPKVSMPDLSDLPWEDPGGAA